MRHRRRLRWAGRRTPGAAVEPYPIEDALNMAKSDRNWPGLVAEIADRLDEVRDELARKHGRPFVPVEIDERLLTRATFTDVVELEALARRLAAALDAARAYLPRTSPPGPGPRHGTAAVGEPADHGPTERPYVAPDTWAGLANYAGGAAVNGAWTGQTPVAPTGAQVVTVTGNRGDGVVEEQPRRASLGSPLLDAVVEYGELVWEAATAAAKATTRGASQRDRKRAAETNRAMLAAFGRVINLAEGRRGQP